MVDKIIAKEQILCPRCKSNQITLLINCSCRLSFMINPKNKEIECFGESGYEEELGLNCECTDCKHFWKSRKYKNIDDLNMDLTTQIDNKETDKK